MSIQLPYVKGTNEKLRHIPRTRKIKFTFYTENSLHKLLCKSKDRVATDYKSNNVYKIGCRNYEDVHCEL